MLRIWVKLKDSPTTKKYINENDFNENKMIKFSEDELSNQKKVGEISMEEILKQGKAPGLISSRGITGTKGSTDFNGKLDSGAMEDLLDRGLEAAKPRINERKKLKGKGFQKIKQVRVSKKKK